MTTDALSAGEDHSKQKKKMLFVSHINIPPRQIKDIFQFIIVGECEGRSDSDDQAGSSHE